MSTQDEFQKAWAQTVKDRIGDAEDAKQQYAVLITELEELQSFKKHPYYERLSSWIEVQRSVLTSEMMASMNPDTTHKLSGGLALLNQLFLLVNAERQLLDAIKELQQQAKQSE